MSYVRNEHVGHVGVGKTHILIKISNASLQPYMMDVAEKLWIYKSVVIWQTLTCTRIFK